jgi:general nucleoside transport system permease protein
MLDLNEQSGTAAAAIGPTPATVARSFRLGRFNLEVRQQLPVWRQALILGAAVMAGLLLSGLILLLAGVSASNLFQEFIVNTLFDEQNFRAVLFQAAPLILVGVGASAALRVRFWNLGIEGQMICGGIAATSIFMFEIGPPLIRLPLMLVVAAAAGTFWVLIVFFLKHRFKVNEIISTLLMNYIAMYLLFQLVYGPWKDPIDGFPHTPAYRLYERLPDFAAGYSSALLLAAVMTAVVWWLVHISRAGFYMNFLDANDRMAQAMGVPINAIALVAVLLSGALSGIAGFAVCSGQEGRLTQSFFEGYGFSGILIAFLGRTDPLAAAIVAVLVAMLFITGQSLQVFYQIPFAMVQLIQAIIVICVAASEFMLRHRIHWVR